MKLDFEEHGSGFPVLLLHAFPLSRKMWKPQIEAFTAENVRLVLPDLRGFGGSGLDANISRMEEMADDIAELLDRLDIKQAVIGGLSMGGYVTFNLYRLRPELFRAMIMCDTNSADDSQEKRENRFKLIENIIENGTQALIDNMLPHLTGSFTKANNKDLIAKLTRMFAETDPLAAIAALRGMAERSDHTYLLPEIDVPTLLVFGEEDELTDLKIAEGMHEKIRDSRLSVIKDAGHYSNLEQPEQFDQAVVSFLREIIG